MFSVYFGPFHLLILRIKGHFNIFLWCVINVLSGVLDLILMDRGIFLSCQFFFLRPQKEHFCIKKKIFISLWHFSPFYCYTFKMAGKEENDFKFKLCLISFDDKYHNMMMTITHLKDKAMIMCLIIFFKFLQNIFSLQYSLQYKGGSSIFQKRVLGGLILEFSL